MQFYIRPYFHDTFFYPTLSRFIHVLSRLSSLSLHCTSQTPKQKFSLHSEAPYPARFTLYTRSSYSESVYILVCFQEDSCLDDFVGTSFSCDWNVKSCFCIMPSSYALLAFSVPMCSRPEMYSLIIPRGRSHVSVPSSNFQLKFCFPASVFRSSLA